MQKIKKWISEQSRQSKIIFIITICLFLVFCIYKTPPYLLTDYGLDIFLARFLGTFFGITISIIAISYVVAFFPYLIFRKIAEKYKKYFDYFTIIFLAISILYFWVNLSHPILRTF